LDPGVFRKVLGLSLTNIVLKYFFQRFPTRFVICFLIFGIFPVAFMY